MASSERESSKDLVELLNGPADFSRWKYLIVNKFLEEDETEDIFRKKVIITEEEGEEVVTKNGAPVRPVIAKKYIRAERKMNSYLVKKVNPTFSRQFHGLKRFHQMWKAVDETVNGQKDTKLTEIRSNLLRMEYRNNNLESLLNYFGGLVADYRALEGQMKEEELVMMLLDALPEKFAPTVIQIRREAIRDNAGKLKIAETIRDLRIAAPLLERKRKAAQPRYGNMTYSRTTER